MNIMCLTGLALLAFAGNSVLCRLALSAGLIDPGSFTVLRLLSGIVMLFALLWFSSEKEDRTKTVVSGTWLGGMALFAYAVFFSYAYVDLSTATGALILFGTVQVSLVLYGIARGLRPGVIEYGGILLACFGLVYLLWPELSKPSVLGLVFMIIAGVAWAAYTVLGQGSVNPLTDTAHHFLKSAPFVVALVILMSTGYLGDVFLSYQGGVLAIASGAITSGVGYALWYAALRRISHTTAAVSQLSVPILAAMLGLILASEGISVRLAVSSVLVLGGMLMVILARESSKKATS